MDTRHAYNQWSTTYDAVINKTRDMEAQAIRSVLKEVRVKKILELGCGTGKNSAWLAEKCTHLTAVDFSKMMLDVARAKVKNTNVSFCEADLTLPWPFPPVDLITCSLVLEHIGDLSFVFREAAEKLEKGGHFYVCELHPYKQLQGSRASFERDGNLLQPDNFIHHVSAYFQAAKDAGFFLQLMNEWFDGNDKSLPPRLISFLFLKR